MNKIAKVLLIFLIISIGLNIVFLTSILQSEVATDIGIKKTVGEYRYTEKRDQLKEDPIAKIEKTMKDQRPTFKMLNADPSEYLGEKLTLYGYAELSRCYYNWGYSNAHNSHYSFWFGISRFDRICIYFPKSKKNKELFELLGSTDFYDVVLKVEMKELESRYELRTNQYLAEGLKWEIVFSRIEK